MSVVHDVQPSGVPVQTLLQHCSSLHLVPAYLASVCLGALRRLARQSQQKLRPQRQVMREQPPLFKMPWPHLGHSLHPLRLHSITSD